MACDGAVYAETRGRVDAAQEKETPEGLSSAMLAATRIPRAPRRAGRVAPQLCIRAATPSRRPIPCSWGWSGAGPENGGRRSNGPDSRRKKQLHEVDKRRTITFGLWRGVTWCGICTQFLTRSCRPCGRASNFAMRSSHDKINNTKALRSLVGLVATEQLIHTPFVFLPCFYMTKGGGRRGRR